MNKGAAIIEIVTVTAQCIFPLAVIFLSAGFIHGITEYNRRHKK